MLIGRISRIGAVIIKNVKENTGCSKADAIKEVVGLDIKNLHPWELDLVEVTLGEDRPIKEWLQEIQIEEEHIELELKLGLGQTLTVNSRVTPVMMREVLNKSVLTEISSYADRFNIKKFMNAL